MDIIEEQLLAYNSRDLERFIATYSVDIVIEDDENNILMRGHEQMRSRYGPLFAGSPQLHARIVNRLRLGKFTVDEEDVTGSAVFPEGVHALVVYRVEDNKIAHVRFLR